ncbi:MAG: 16S rRNA (guanine(527)-N(7))-methyltransferase RsmG [Treponema sp.]|nr:16S rRNA (guanine(527)-N(7))-methyltransferase RsmG [Treponema sp.]
MPDILSDGLLQLCQNDPGVDHLISPRREVILQLLNQYIAEIERFNPALSLVGTNDRQELIVRHILDSLAPLAILIKETGLATQTDSARQLHIADVGSGAGLPGIPLAIVLPDVQCTLIERMGRRAGFLRHTQTVLNLCNTFVEEGEMEKAQRGRFALVTFRAFRPLEPKIFKRLLRLCSAGGVLAAYKGRRSKTETEMAMLTQTLPDLPIQWKLLPCPVPMLDEERHLLIMGTGD